MYYMYLNNYLTLPTLTLTPAEQTQFQHTELPGAVASLSAWLPHSHYGLYGLSDTTPYLRCKCDCIPVCLFDFLPACLHICQSALLCN